MSYILDALKKLEQEKSKKTRKDGVINISGALFEHDCPKPSAAVGRKIVLVVTVAVLVTFGASWLMLRPVTVRESPLPQLASAIPPIKIETAPVSPEPPLVHLQQTQPKTAPIPAAPVKVNPVKQSVQHSIPQPVVVPTAPVAEDAASLLTIQELRKRMKERKGQTLSVDQTIAAPADIKLSGIAWQDERRARRAVVNGFLIQEGSVVSGARITDIYQDRVRFSLSGKFFEIPLNSSGISAAGK